MKRAILSAFLALACFTGKAQQKIHMRPLRSKPQVHVKFGEYIISFSIVDINKAMQLLPENEAVLYGTTSGLDTANNYVIELLEGRRMEYLNKLQPLMQNGVGVFLLMTGRGLVEKNGRKLSDINAKMGPTTDLNGTYALPVDFYDPKSGKMLFSGMMDADLYKKDIGFDD